MNNQYEQYLLEFARIKLRSALLDLSGGTKGQLEALNEHPPADKNAYPRRHIHQVELDDGKGGVKRVNVENSAMYVLETFSRRRPAPPINDFEFADSPWRRAVNALDVSQQAWLRYCYGGDLSFKHQTAICETVWNLYKKIIPQTTQCKVVKRLISLVWLAVQEVAAVHKREDYKGIAGAALASLMSVSRSTWCETYAPHWQGMKCLVRELDEAALTGVLNHMRIAI
ncbi:antitermination protein [Salmonella enterica subsp. enterica]|nr:antitermination protein [Salmonella enterica subsp. enterica]